MSRAVPTRPTRAQRAVRSLLAMLIGWTAGYAYYVVSMRCCTEGHRVTDEQAMLIWSAVFVLLGWLTVGLPLALLDLAFLRSAAGSSLTGIAAGVGSFVVLLSWSPLWREPLFLGYAAVVGGVTGAAYWALAGRAKESP